METIIALLVASGTLTVLSYMLPKSRQELVVAKATRDNVIHVDFKAKRRAS